MKQFAVFLFLVLVFTSCDSFHRLHYRHVRKVPATPVVFAATPEQFSPERSTDISADSIFENEEPLTVAGYKSSDTMRATSRDSVVALFTESFTKKLEAAKSLNRKVEHFQQQQRRDWSLAWAVLFIVTGLLLLLYVVLMLSAGGPMLLGRILLSIAISFAAVTLLIRGFSMFFNRFRSNKGYKEAGN